MNRFLFILMLVLMWVLYLHRDASPTSVLVEDAEPGPVEQVHTAPPEIPHDSHFENL